MTEFLQSTFESSGTSELKMPPPSKPCTSKMGVDTLAEAFAIDGEAIANPDPATVANAVKARSRRVIRRRLGAPPVVLVSSETIGFALRLMLFMVGPFGDVLPLRS